MDSSCSGWVKVTKSQWDRLNETIGFCVWWFCVGRGLSFAENKISHLRLQRNGVSNWLGFVVGPVEWCCCSYGLQKFLDAWPTVGNLGTKLCGSPLMGSTSLIGLNSSTSAHFTTYFHSPILKIKQTFNSGWSLTFDVSLISCSTLLVVYFPVAIGVKAVLITTFLKDRESHNLTILLVEYILTECIWPKCIMIECIHLKICVWNDAEKSSESLLCWIYLSVVMNSCGMPFFFQ